MYCAATHRGVIPRAERRGLPEQAGHRFLALLQQPTSLSLPSRSPPGAGLLRTHLDSQSHSQVTGVPAVASFHSLTGSF